MKFRFEIRGPNVNVTTYPMWFKTMEDARRWVLVKYGDRLHEFNLGDIVIIIPGTIFDNCVVKILKEEDNGKPNQKTN